MALKQLRLQLQMAFENFFDLFSAGRHSRYFNQTRSHYLFRRVRVIAILLALIQPAWLIVDYLLLPADMLASIGLARGMAAFACLLLALWGNRRYQLPFSGARVVCLVVILSLFQTVSSSLLISHGHGTAVAGYHFFPFMIICMMAIFPLAIVEVTVYTIAVLLIELATQLVRGTAGSVDAINSLWLLTVLGMIAGWASVNQLNMLLGLYRQATRDPLTSLSNRRQAMDQLNGDIGQSREKRKPLSVLLFDLDKFKSFNDTYGHAAGDIVLKVFAKILNKGCRKRLDLACRYGGEEFLMILPQMDAKQAAEVAESIRVACHEASVKTPTGENIGFTTSIGVAEISSADSLDSLLQRADEALYAAKASGRDQYKVAA